MSQNWLVVLGSNNADIANLFFLLFLVCFISVLFDREKKCLTKERKSVSTDFFLFMTVFPESVYLLITPEYLIQQTHPIWVEVLLHWFY